MILLLEYIFQYSFHHWVYTVNVFDVFIFVSNVHIQTAQRHRLTQWFSNFLHQVPPQKIFGFPSTTIMTNIKMHYKWLPTAPGVCSRCVCVCVCVCVHCCVCVHFGWVKCRAQIQSMSLSVALYTVKQNKKTSQF